MRFVSLTIFLIISISSTTCCNAQQTKIDSLRLLIAVAQEDSLKINLLESLAQTYVLTKKIDSTIFSYQQALELNQKLNYSVLRQCYNMSAIGYFLYITGNYAKSLEYAAKTLQLSEKLNNAAQRGHANMVFGHNYLAMGNYRQSLNHFFEAKRLFETIENPGSGLERPIGATQFIGDVYFQTNKLDSAFFFTSQAYSMAIAMSNVDPIGAQYHIDYSFRIFGNIYCAKGNDQLALNYYRQFISDFYRYNLNNREIGHVYYNIAKIFEKRKQIDSAIFYSKNSLETAKTYQDKEHLYKAAIFLYNLYKSTSEHQAFFFYKLASDARDSLINSDKIKQTEILTFNEQIRQKEKKETDARVEKERKIIIIICSVAAIIVTFLLWNRIRQLRLRHKMILEQKETEKLKTKYEKDLLTLEAKALRAQMNPHFIFNSMNSIKSLINKNENEKAANYLTTFSKLIRTLFQNSDKREVSLYEEIETCKLYTQLERMRFGDNIKFIFNVDETIDLKDIKVPALILQPLIENAIWHGLVPKETGGTIVFSIKETDGTVECVIDDDGIGRELSNQYKAQYRATHESKGIGMTQSRLELDKLLNEREDKILIIDKEGENGKPKGTKVIISFKEV